MTGRTVDLEHHKHRVNRLPLARVRIHVSGFDADLDVAVQENLGYDVLLGLVFPYTWDAAFRELDKATVLLVQTRQQARKEREAREIETTPQQEQKELPEEVQREVADLTDSTPEESSEEDRQSSGESAPEVEADGPAEMDGLERIKPNKPVGKSKDLSRGEKRAAQEVRNQLVAIPSILEAGPTELSQLQKDDTSLHLLWDLAQKGNEYCVRGGLLYRKTVDQLGRERQQLVVPKSHRAAVLRLAHRPGHLGRDRTKVLLAENFYWPGWDADVRRVCMGCPQCQRVGRRRKKVAPLQPLPTIGTPFLRVTMDFVGPLPRTAKGKEYVIILADYATRWPEAQVTSSTSSKVVAEFLCDVFNRLGTPDEILTDRGTGFVSRMLHYIYKVLGISSITTTPLPPPDGWDGRKAEWYCENYAKEVHVSFQRTVGYCSSVCDGGMQELSQQDNGLLASRIAIWPAAAHAIAGDEG